MKKGFTLVELLAIIILLAVMSLVSFPIINNMIKTSKINNDKQLVKTIIDEATIFYNDYVFKNKQDEIINKNIYNLMTTSDKPEQGILYVNGLGQVSIAVVYNNNCYTKDYTDTNINHSKYSGDCVVKYVDPILNGADPELDEGMIPVVIASDGTLTKADLKKEWYNYNDKKWANIVLVSEDVRNEYMNAEPGTNINTSKVLAYYVWIPRYKYEIFGTKEDIKVNQDYNLNSVQLINVIFENKYTTKSNGSKKGTFVTHPAFTFGDDELNGFWVGKFETTGTAAKPTILPNVKSLIGVNTSNQFKISLKFANNTLNSDGSITHSNNNVYGINNTDAHMMKNTEWGAVAYLTTSKYGQGLTEVRINNSSNYTTGCSATNPTTDLPNDYVDYMSGCQNKYNTSIGVLASTTGNITGIYDMSGGTREYMMSVMLDKSGEFLSGRNNLYNSGFTGNLGCPTCDPASGSDPSITRIDGITYPNSKYYDLYNYSASYADVKAYNYGKLGDATYELGGFTQNNSISNSTIGYYSQWHNDYAHFIHNGGSWFTRGGNYSYGSGAGIFAFRNFSGPATDITFRSVLAK